jgi:ribosomal protein S2
MRQAILYFASVHWDDPMITPQQIALQLARRYDVLYVGTKRGAKTVIRGEALRASCPFVTERWLGGTLTNFDTIRGRLTV